MGYADASSGEKERASNDDGTARSFEENQEGDDEMKLAMKLPPPPPRRLSTPADPFRGGGGGGLFSGSIGGSIIWTPDPLVVHSNLVNNIDLLNQEVVAAAPAASEMQYRSERFDSGWLSHQLGATTATTTPVRAFDLSQFAAAQQQQNPSMMPDPYSLPPFLQGYLDETYAASTIVFPRHPSNSDDADGGGIRDDVYLQVMAYRRNGGGGSATPGRTPPHVSPVPLLNITSGAADKETLRTRGRRRPPAPTQGTGAPAPLRCDFVMMAMPLLALMRWVRRSTKCASAFASSDRIPR